MEVNVNDENDERRISGNFCLSENFEDSYDQLLRVVKLR